MIANRELAMQDYVAMLRRRAKMILIPALLAPAVGKLRVSYAVCTEVHLAIADPG